METKFFSTGSNRILGALALLMVIIALGAYALYTFKQSEYMYFGPTTISVTGESEVMAVPDVGTFNFSVLVKKADAATARTENAEKVSSIIAYLKEKGVEEKDIKNEYFNLYQTYRSENRVCPYGSYCPGGEQIPDGFEVTQTIAVKVRAIDTAGDLIAGVTDLGATNLSDLAFTVDDDSAQRNQARSEAIADAKSQATALAKELGMSLGRITSFSENEGNSVPYYNREMNYAMDAGAEAVKSTPLPVGENSTKSSVTMTYQLN